MNAHVDIMLGKIAAISIKYDKIAEITGGRFNIFSILGLESREVRTHSRFLVALLSPDGNHGLGSLPLKKFLEVCEIHEFPTAGTQVDYEYDIGPLNEAKTEGGRIDILIRSKDHRMMVAVENKIYAGDQENQLLRYHNFLEKNNANRGLIYLTLDGSAPSEHSTGGDKGVQYTPISYAVKILQWLEAIHKETADKPIVRESIKQYINLIKKLTGKTESDEMAEEIAKAITTNNENLKAFFSMYDSYDAVFRYIAEKNEAEWQAIAERNALKKPEIKMHSGRYAGIYFTNEALQSRHISLGFEFDAAHLGKLYFGIYDGEKLDSGTRSELKEKFREQFHSVQEAGSWPAFQYWREYEDGRELLIRLNSPEADTFNRALEKKLQMLLKIVEDK